MPPRTTTWKLEAHTFGKHRVLENYMLAWLPIMLRFQRRVLFVDGFAGPGEYRDGEKGSPIIALDSFTNHTAFSRMQGRITFVFIEKETDRSEHLDSLVEPYRDILPKSGIRVFNSPFVEKMTEILDIYESSQWEFPPAFVMIDPFGVRDAPMHVIRRILTKPSTEIYISFMYDSINRFWTRPELEQHLDDLFGCTDWRGGRSLSDEDSKKAFLYELYENCLREAGANYVLRFELYKGQRLIYAIFFATQRLEGCDVMKRAMWKTAPFGDFQFKGGTANQLTLGIEPTDFTPLRRDLQNEYGHRE